MGYISALTYYLLLLLLRTSATDDSRTCPSVVVNRVIDQYFLVCCTIVLFTNQLHGCMQECSINPLLVVSYQKQEDPGNYPSCGVA